jgi:hypothetical protein
MKLAVDFLALMLYVGLDRWLKVQENAPRWWGEGVQAANADRGSLCFRLANYIYNPGQRKQLDVVVGRAQSISHSTNLLSLNHRPELIAIRTLFH